MAALAGTHRSVADLAYTHTPRGRWISESAAQYKWTPSFVAAAATVVPANNTRKPIVAQPPALHVYKPTNPKALPAGKFLHSSEVRYETTPTTQQVAKPAAVIVGAKEMNKAMGVAPSIAEAGIFIRGICHSSSNITHHPNSQSSTGST